MIEVRPASELDVMLAYHNRKKVYDGEVDALDNTVACLRAGYPMRSLWVGRDVIGVVGYTPYWKGVGAVAAIFTDDVEKYPVAFMKVMRSLLSEYMSNLHRMEFTVKAEYDKGIRFAEALGFQREGVLRKYTADGSDCIIFGRIK